MTIIIQVINKLKFLVFLLLLINLRMDSSNKLQHNDIIFYNTPNGNVKIEVIFNEETFWLTQKRMAELFGVEVPAVNKHMSNIYETGELDRKSTISILETVQQEGSHRVKRNVEFYNLDAIIAVCYRVNSHQANQFRIRAAKTLREFIVKGFIVGCESLKQGKRFGKDYFDQLPAHSQVAKYFS
jgi:hypothetical protein